MQRELISTPNAPTPVGPYSQGILAEGRYLFAAGQVGIDPQTGKVVEGGIQAQTRQVLENLKAVLEAAGTSLQQVVKVTVLLSDMANFAQMNEVYASYFTDSPPARATFGVQLPPNMLVEIECIALAER